MAQVVTPVKHIVIFPESVRVSTKLRNSALTPLKLGSTRLKELAVFLQQRLDLRHFLLLVVLIKRLCRFDRDQLVDLLVTLLLLAHLKDQLVHSLVLVVLVNWLVKLVVLVVTSMLELVDKLPMRVIGLELDYGLLLA